MIYIIYNQTLYYKFNKVQSITHWLFEELFLVAREKLPALVALTDIEVHVGNILFYPLDFEKQPRRSKQTLSIDTVDFHDRIFLYRSIYRTGSNVRDLLARSTISAIGFS